jgi:hypothetical protein
VSKRSRIVGFGSAGLLVVAGIACAVVFSGGLGQNLAFGLVALGLVEGTALVFYEVGLTEDHERAREQRARESGPDPGENGRPEVSPRPSGPHESEHPGRLSRPRGGLDRKRGRPRRLR